MATVSTRNRNLFAGLSTVIFVFFAIELTTGIVSGINALKADALHMLTDFVAHIIGLISENLYLNEVKKDENKRKEIKAKIENNSDSNIDDYVKRERQRLEKITEYDQEKQNEDKKKKKKKENKPKEQETTEKRTERIQKEKDFELNRLQRLYEQENIAYKKTREIEETKRLLFDTCEDHKPLKFHRMNTLSGIISGVLLFGVGVSVQIEAIEKCFEEGPKLHFELMKDQKDQDAVRNRNHIALRVRVIPYSQMNKTKHLCQQFLNNTKNESIPTFSLIDPKNKEYGEKHTEEYKPPTQFLPGLDNKLLAIIVGCIGFCINFLCALILAICFEKSGPKNKKDNANSQRSFCWLFWRCSICSLKNRISEHFKEIKEDHPNFSNVLFHVLGDCLISVVAIISSVIAYFCTQNWIQVFDVLLSAIAGSIILRIAIHNTLDLFDVMLGYSDKDIVTKLENAIFELNENLYFQTKVQQIKTNLNIGIVYIDIEKSLNRNKEDLKTSQTKEDKASETANIKKLIKELRTKLPNYQLTIELINTDEQPNIYDEHSNTETVTQNSADESTSLLSKDQASSIHYFYY